MARLNPAKSLEAERLRRAENIFATLLLIYPGSHRRQFAGEMQQTFRDLYRDYARGSRDSANFWGRLILDMAQSATHEHIRLLTSFRVMKIHIKNSASTTALLWGIALTAPIPLLVVVGLIFQYFGLQLGGTSWGMIGFVTQVILPLVGLIINLLALVRTAHNTSLSFASWSGAKRYLWTVVFVGAIFAWIAFLFNH